MADAKRPATEHSRDIATDERITGMKRDEKVSAAIIGSDSIDISIIIPATRIVRTIHMATSTVIA